MLGLRTPLSSLLRPSPFASSSRTLLPSLPAFTSPSPFPTSFPQQVRFRGQLAPKRTKHRKSQKGRPSLPTGGSLKGTSLEHGSFGLRVLASTRLTANQLSSAQVAIKRKIKPIKGAECFLRVFPDVPVCVKGNETRMGKGKGSFEYWACRVPVGRVVFEIGGGGIREEIAKQALKLAQVKLPVPTEFISTGAPPRLGAISSSTLSPPSSASPSLAKLAGLEAKDEEGAVDVVMKREDVRVEGLTKGLEGLGCALGMKGEAEARA